MNSTIVRRPATTFVGMARRFPPAEIPQIPALWGRFGPKMATVPGRTEPAVCYGLCVADPKGERGAPALEYTAAVAVRTPPTVPDGMVAISVPATTYAVFTHDGPIHEIGKTWDAIHQGGLAEAKLAQAGGPEFERYDERWNPKTGLGPVDIYIPVVDDAK